MKAVDLDLTLDREVWAEITNHPGYWVSSEGRVRSPRRILKPGKRTRTGHLAVTLSGGVHMNVHRLVALAFIPNPQGLPMVLHAEDDPSNNRVGSLRWGTARDNSADAFANGRRKARVHGTASMYRGGCRCADCRAAYAAYLRARQAADPAGAERRRAASKAAYHRKKRTK